MTELNCLPIMTKMSNEQRREKGEKAGLKRQEKSPQSVIGPDLLLCGSLSPSVSREEGQGDRIH